MPAGRPTLYSENYPEKAKRYALLGLTDEQMAAAFDVCTDTLNEWKKRHPEFSVAIKEGRLDADGKVVTSLYTRANGYTKTKDVVVNGEIVTLEEDVPPDPTSMIFWLKNRQPKLWRDKQDIDHSSTDGSMSPKALPDRLVFKAPDKTEG